MRALYRVLRAIVRFTLWVYYPRTYLLNRERFRMKGPFIVVSNHPNTLMDPFQAVAPLREQVFFLANASLFRTPFQDWFFTTFYCIKVERPQDTNGRPLNNEEAFARCDRHLQGGHNLYMAPEGGSFMERRLRPLKTGVARIAFSAEQGAGWELGLRILPIGLTYEAPNHFRSRVWVEAGEPILVADFQDLYREDPKRAVRELTKVLRDRLRPLLIHTEDEAEEVLLARLETLLGNNRPLPAAGHFRRSQRLLARLHRWRDEAPSAYARFTKKVAHYFSRIGDHRTSDAAVVAAQQPGWLRKRMLQTILALLALPVGLYGAINHLAAAGIPAWLARRLNLYIGYDSTVKYISGLVTFPLFYYLQFKLTGLVAPAPWPWLYLLSLPLTGWLAWKYWGWADRLRAQWRLKAKNQQELISLREDCCVGLPDL